MNSTTIRVSKETRAKLKKISAEKRISLAALVDELVEEREKRFWEGFGEEAKARLSPTERAQRAIFDGALKDGLAK